MEYGAAVVEQELDVKKFKRLVAILDDALAELKTLGPFQLELAGALEILVVGDSEDSGRPWRSGWVRPFRGCDDLDQHLAQFRPSMGADDDGLAAFELGRIRGETTYLVPQAVSNQIG